MMRRERPDHTLSPTAVVHEAVIRLLGDGVFNKAADRTFLFASAARAMREVLIEHARRRAADRHGGGRRRVPLDAAVDYFEGQRLDLVAVHEALDRLAERDDRQAQVMTLRYFGGMTVAEVAEALGVSIVTVERDWRLARAWLVGQLGGGEE
jgi:RNA polymerase sigma factor (TIGR02999 family)